MEDEIGEGKIRARTVWLLLFLVVLGALVRFYPLRHEALDGDELFSMRVALSPVSSAYIAVRDDLVHPPLYYALLKAGISLWGASAVGLRVLSLSAGLLAIPVVWLLGRRMGSGDTGGLLAVGVVALSRYDVFYSQEARSYALYTLLVLLFVLWIGRISVRQDRLSWAMGAALMVMLLYVHYVAALYVILGVLTLLVSQVKSSVKWTACAIAVAAGICFLPWLSAVANVYRLKHGVGQNLDWQGHPHLYDLASIWALSLGIPELRRATTFALVLVFMLTSAAVIGETSRRMLRKNLLFLTCLVLGVFPPLLLFLLSRPPVNLPLFGLRHVLPSTVLLCLVCCHGLVLLSKSAGSYRRVVLAGGAVLVLAMAGIPTVTVLLNGPARYPYNVIEQQVAAEERQGVPAYTTWLYGIGEPVNFYCHSPCVSEFASEYRQLPGRFILLYRPSKRDDEALYESLRGRGFRTVRGTYYTNGEEEASGTEATIMEREAPAGSKSP